MDQVFIVIGLLAVIGVCVLIGLVMSGTAGISFKNVETGKVKGFGSLKDDK